MTEQRAGELGLLGARICPSRSRCNMSRYRSSSPPPQTTSPPPSDLYSSPTFGLSLYLHICIISLSVFVLVSDFNSYFRMCERIRAVGAEQDYDRKRRAGKEPEGLGRAAAETFPAVVLRVCPWQVRPRRVCPFAAAHGTTRCRVAANRPHGRQLDLHHRQQERLRHRLQAASLRGRSPFGGTSRVSSATTRCAVYLEAELRSVTQGDSSPAWPTTALTSSSSPTSFATSASPSRNRAKPSTSSAA
jgi:hypothetical protein